MKNKVYARVSSLDEGEERLRSLIAITEQELTSYEDTYVTNISQSAAILRQIERLRKRCVLSNAVDLRKLAFDNFLELNGSVSNTPLDLCSSFVSDATDFIRHALERYTSSISGDVQNSLNLGYLLQNWTFGPGSSAGVEGTHFFEKLVSDNLTVTKGALPYAKLLRKLNPHIYRFDANRTLDFTLVRGSKLSSVPKNEDTERTICIEPLYNMALQLAAGKYIEGALRAVGIDIRDQQGKNKNLAGIGSITDGLATIDLKSASDLISLSLIKTLWPPEWYALFTAIRSPECNVAGDWHTLNMVSTMGNGFTFPMMTLTLLALLYAVSPSKKRFFVDYTTCGVYGDDIICPVDSFLSVKNALVNCRLIVNEDKSYSAGPFRESCGGDFWFGVNITPFYLSTLSSDPDIYNSINKILDWCGRNNLFLPRTLEFLLSMLDGKPCLVPEWMNPDQGVRTNLVSGRYSYWAPELRRKVICLDAVDDNLALLLVIGGYVTSSSGSKVCYMPRSNKTRYVLEHSRLPRGFCDGTDYSSNSSRENSAAVSQLLSWLL